MKVYVVGINVYDEADIVVGVYDDYKKAVEAQESLAPFYCDTYGECDVTLTEFELNQTEKPWRQKYAYLYAVSYKWPGDENWRYGFIIHTNMDNDSACDICGIDDSGVLIYTDVLGVKYIKENFDGLEIKLLGIISANKWR